MPTWWQAWLILGSIVNLCGLSNPKVRSHFEQDKSPYAFRMIVGSAASVVIVLGWPAIVVAMIATYIGRGK